MAAAIWLFHSSSEEKSFAGASRASANSAPEDISADTTTKMPGNREVSISKLEPGANSVDLIHSTEPLTSEHNAPRFQEFRCRRSQGCGRVSPPVVEPAESCGIVPTGMLRRIAQPLAVMTASPAGLALLVAAGLAWIGGVQPASAQGKDIVVFAAASLQNALDEIARHWQRETGKKAVISYAASNTLIKRIEHGAPADIFFSADLDWMDYGQQKDLIRPDTRFNLLENRLVLIAPRGCAG